MKLEIVILFAVVICSTCANQFSSKNDDMLVKKLAQLLDWSSRHAVISFNTDQFKTYVKHNPRNYSMIVMLTALSPSRKCQVCRASSDEFALVASSWRNRDIRNSELFFVMVDYDDGPEVFNMLHQNSAPIFIHFPAKGVAKKADYMNVANEGFGAEILSKWIQERTKIQITVIRPPNYNGLILLALLVFMTATLLYFKPNSFDFLNNRRCWGAISLVLIFTMLSGQMWNHIRAPPLMHAQDGQVMYIYPSGDFQFVAETFIVMFLYVATAAGLLIMNETRLMSAIGSKKKKLCSLTGLAVFLVFLSLIIYVFRSKYRGYPYRLLF